MFEQRDDTESLIRSRCPHERESENRLFFTEAPFISIVIYDFIICSTIHFQKIDDFIAVKFYLILSMYERTERRMYIDPLCLSTVYGIIQRYRKTVNEPEPSLRQLTFLRRAHHIA